MAMAGTDTVFSGAIPAIYDRYLGVGKFGPYADRITAGLGDLRAGALLEVAAGTGIATAVLARSLPAEGAITATGPNGAVLEVARAKAGVERVRRRQAAGLRVASPDGAVD